MTYIGIDPGKDGAMALIMDKTVTIIPFDERGYEIALETVRGSEAVCCLERVGAMPGQGVTSMFKFGENFGYIRGLLQANGIAYELVTPQKWKKEFGATDKNSAVTVCGRLFPSVSLLRTPRCKKEHDGMAEALLMAEYARRKLG